MLIHTVAYREWDLGIPTPRGLGVRTVKCNLKHLSYLSWATSRQSVHMYMYSIHVGGQTHMPLPKFWGIQMLFTRLKYSKIRPDSKVKVTRSKIVVSIKRFTHVKYQSLSTRFYIVNLWTKITRSKVLVLTERSCLPEYSCEISNL